MAAVRDVHWICRRHVLLAYSTVPRLGVNTQKPVFCTISTITGLYCTVILGRERSRAVPDVAKHQHNRVVENGAYRPQQALVRRLAPAAAIAINLQAFETWCTSEPGGGGRHPLHNARLMRRERMRRVPLEGDGNTLFNGEGQGMRLDHGDGVLDGDGKGVLGRRRRGAAGRQHQTNSGRRRGGTIVYGVAEALLDGDGEALLDGDAQLSLERGGESLVDGVGGKLLDRIC